MWWTITDWFLAVITWIYFLLVIDSLLFSGTYFKEEVKKTKTAHQNKVNAQNTIASIIIILISLAFWESLRYYLFDESVILTIANWGRWAISNMG